MADLIREPAVAFVAGETERGGIWVAGSEGEAYLRVRGGEIHYQPSSGDPLMMGGSWSGLSREWLKRTWNGTYPDAPFHLMDQFRSHRAGDLLVIAREGFDLRARFELPEHRSGHGSLIRVHMQTPVWSSQPIPNLPLRTVDLFPAMLHWLGIAVPWGIDGESVWLPERTRQLRKITPEVVLA